MAKKFTTLLLSKRLCKDKDIIQAYITSNLQMQSHFSSIHRMREIIIYKFNTKQLITEVGSGKRTFIKCLLCSMYKDVLYDKFIILIVTKSL